MISELKFTNHNCKCPFILVFMLLLMLTIKTLHRRISRLKHRQNINIENMKHTNIVITSTFQINLRKHQPCIDPISKPLGPAWWTYFSFNQGIISWPKAIFVLRTSGHLIFSATSLHNIHFLGPSSLSKPAANFNYVHIRGIQFLRFSAFIGSQMPCFSTNLAFRGAIWMLRWWRVKNWNWHSHFMDKYL